MSRHRPSRAAFRAAAAEANLIAVFRELVLDGETPVGAYARLAQAEWSFLLESVVGGDKWAAYSFLGVAPRATMEARDGELVVEWRDLEAGGASRVERIVAADATAALAEVLARFRPAPAPELPRFWGGAVGWLGYDAVRAFERLPALAPDDLGLPVLAMVLTDTVVVFDNLRQTLKLVATALVPDGATAATVDAAYDAACRRVDALAEVLHRPTPSPLALLQPPSEVPDVQSEARSSFSRSAFLAAVGRAREHILAGDAFQVVLSQRFELPCAGADPFDVYRALRVVNPSPYMFHLDFPAARVTGASPECLVRLDEGRIELSPIAGTRPRGATPEADRALEAELCADPKERAEHVMLVDLGRNDVGRVARIGTVRVDEQMAVERYSHVMHLVSSVSGELRAGATALDVLRAAFPAGTLSGAPKVRAMELIEELEPHRRGIYGGAVGYLGYGGNLDLAIAIRTVVTVGARFLVQAGAGIVFDSVAEREVDETVHKARGVLRAIELARGATRVGA